MGTTGEGGTRLRARLRAASFLGIVGVGLYAAVVVYIGWGPIAATAQAIDLRLVAALMAVEAVALSLRALKWRIVLGAGRGAAGVFFLSKAGGNLSPARVGELSPLLLREYRNTKTAAWILADRAIEVAVTLALGALGAIALSVSLAGLWIPASALAIGGAIAGSVMAFKPWRSKTLRARLASNPFIARTAATLANFAGALGQLRGKLPLLVPITIGAKLLDLTVGLLLYLSMGHAVTYAALAVAQSVHGLTSAVPITPNATGVPYATAGAFLHEAARIPLEALAFAVPLRMAAAGTVFWVLFGCCCYVNRQHLGAPVRALGSVFSRRPVAPIPAEAGDELG